MPPVVFINYRRDDAEGEANHLADDLILSFGRQSVFFDQRTITAGKEWPLDLQNMAEECTVLLAVIGPHWHRQFDVNTGKNRLDQQGDWVRREIETALQFNKQIVPVLVRGIELPVAAIREEGRGIAGLAEIESISLGVGDEREPMGCVV